MARPMTLAALAREAGAHVPTAQSWLSRQRKGKPTPVPLPQPRWLKADAGVDLWDADSAAVKQWVLDIAEYSDGGDRTDET